MRPESLKLLEDMRQAARDVTAMVTGKSIDAYRTDKQLRWAVERGFEIVGEALTQLRKLDQTTAESITDWRAIISFRNVLIHGYAVVNADKTWDIAISELPTLLRELDAMLS
jgi:uncharacterized protein with HEPN domain